jgi:uncharacterized protein YndB with AHSA1/START domain
MGLDPAALEMRPISETYEVIGAVPAWAHDLERRWQEEESRQRVRVSPEESAFTVSVPTKAPPQVAWEFVTTPGRRTAWQAGVTDVLVTGATGGRRGVGATNHCVHGKEAVLEEILDWRPYDYFSDRSTVPTPAGPVKMLTTLELEPTVDGTIVHFRFAAPKTPKEKAILKEMTPAFEELFRQSHANLIAQLDAELAVRNADRAEEPELPMPKPDGLFSEMRPLVMVG